VNAENKMIIPGRLEELSEVRSKIQLFTTGFFDEITVNRIVLSVDEAVSNIIRHGYGGTCGDITLELKRDPQSISITLTDNAPPFNPLSVESPDPETHFDDGKSGGLGIDFFRRMMNAHYERTSSGENRLILSKEIPHENK